MRGPKPYGFWSKHGRPSWGPLQAGRRYRVIRAFTDFDRVDHPVGEEWIFVGAGYFHYDPGLSLFVSLDGEQEWHIRLLDAPEQQAEIVQALEDYMAAMDG